MLQQAPWLLVTNLSCRYPSDFPLPMLIPCTPCQSLHCGSHPGPRWQGRCCTDVPPSAAQAWCWGHLWSPHLSSGWWLFPRNPQCCPCSSCWWWPQQWQNSTSVCSNPSSPVWQRAAGVGRGDMLVVRAFVWVCVRIAEQTLPSCWTGKSSCIQMLEISPFYSYQSIPLPQKQETNTAKNHCLHPASSTIPSVWAWV